ncbi:Receptor-type tyrosine-protein phosphatase F, partial [Varanus komodoensis]
MGPQLKVVEKARTATMLCAASGNPDPEISWFKDFLPVDTATSNGRIKQLRSGALQIENSEESDQGKYECVATNSAGTRYSAPANLYVRVMYWKMHPCLLESGQKDFFVVNLKEPVPQSVLRVMGRGDYV